MRERDKLASGVVGVTSNPEGIDCSGFEAQLGKILPRQAKGIVEQFKRFLEGWSGVFTSGSEESACITMAKVESHTMGSVRVEFSARGFNVRDTYPQGGSIEFTAPLAGCCYEEGDEQQLVLTS
tara:strand:+ start:65 stop:436 length:372 start_codon:yes stop_codon:yes gene_type:complete